ncbi:MAG: tungstate ABC transporter substrate-binding protein WtpA [Bacteroidales bacterium]|nr:tungstate ABC transporter substrate-binding protein WtpA [Bacteroidales bacterium]MBN2634253.1 tungstate ABC transporter substrate-binding protein WtpA [Bacteroidales bacterium]
MRQILSGVLLLASVLTGCINKSGKKEELIIFHAGSLSVPFKQMANEFEKKHPTLKVLLEPAGSIVCARKITELKRSCDIIASADHLVIERLIIPEYAGWNIRFATNEMVIAYQEKSRYSDEISPDNWTDILLRDDVTYGRSDPDSDPCGYRAVLTMMLAQKFYGKSDLSGRFLAKNQSFIRPKEVDLVALIESNAVDYIFIYRSVAVQHKMKYLVLPDEINLGNPEMNSIYSLVSVDIAGSSPGTSMTVDGEYINYSISVLNDAPNMDYALDFVKMLLGPEGTEIMKINGQEPIVPGLTSRPELIPVILKEYVNG